MFISKGSASNNGGVPFLLLTEKLHLYLRLLIYVKRSVGSFHDFSAKHTPCGPLSALHVKLKKILHSYHLWYSKRYSSFKKCEDSSFVKVFFRLFGGVCPTRHFFPSFGEVTITSEGLQILTFLSSYSHWAVRFL